MYNINSSKKIGPIDDYDEDDIDYDSPTSSSFSVDVCSNSPDSRRFAYSPGRTTPNNNNNDESYSRSVPNVSSNGLPVYCYPSGDYDSNNGVNLSKYVKASDSNYPINLRYLMYERTGGNVDHAGVVQPNNSNGRKAKGSSKGSEKTSSKRKPKCAKCKVHGLEYDLKGHKRYCRKIHCNCLKCLVVTQRRSVVALQVAIRRAQKQDKRTGRTPTHDTTLVRLHTNHIIGSYQVLTAQTSKVPSQTPTSCTNGVNPTEHHRRLQALKQMLESFHSQGVDGALICSYIILKECDFVVEKAYDKILDARNDIGSYTGRDPSNLVSSTSSNYWSTVVPQAATSPSTALLYPQLNCLPSYYGYSFPSSAAAAAAASGGAAAAAAAAGAAAAVGSGHPLLSGAPISLCSYVPPVVQHPSSAGALNSVASSLGGPGPPPPMMEITTSGDSRGSDCRDESDREAPPGPESTRSVSVERGIGSNDDAQSDRTPPGPSTEEAAAASPTSSLVLRRSYPPTSLSFALHSTYKNRAPAIES